MAEAALPILIGGAASALGNYFGAQATANAAQQSAGLQQQRFNQAVSYEQPYMQSGQNALNLYNNATGVNGAAAEQSYYNNFQNDPGFQAGVNYGLQQIQAQNAAQGMGLSGNTLAALQSYSQNALSQEYQTRLSDLFQGAQLGANSANALSAASTSSGTAQGNFNVTAGQSQGSGISGLGTGIPALRTTMQITTTAHKRALEMTPYSSAPAIPPRNALIVAVPQPAPAYRPAPSAPSNLPALLASTIGHTALLSDTPSKWASTIAMLRQNGIDPEGYEDFEKGRPAAMAAAGIQTTQGETE